MEGIYIPELKTNQSLLPTTTISSQPSLDDHISEKPNFLSFGADGHSSWYTATSMP